MELLLDEKSDQNETKCIWKYLKKPKFWAEPRLDPLTGTGNTDMVEFRATICLFIHFLTQIFFNRKILSIFNMKQKSPQRKRGFLMRFFTFKLLGFLWKIPTPPVYAVCRARQTLKIQIALDRKCWKKVSRSFIDENIVAKKFFNVYKTKIS